MNAIRSLPLINRPSRSSSPAPSHVTAQGLTMLPPAVPERQQQVAAMASRPISLPGLPLPVGTPKNGTARSSSAGKRGPSPPSSRGGTPRTSSTPLPAASGTETPQGGYMDVIGMRLNETVNKACAGVDSKTKKGFKKGAGWSIGECVAHELPAPPADTYLLRAILRTAVRSLSIYVSRLDSLLLPALSDPQWVAPLNLTPSATQSPLNPTQAFAVTVAQAAWETCEKLEQMLETVDYPRFVEDTLRPTMDKFDLVVGKVVRPLLFSLKSELEGSLNKTSGVAPKTSTGPTTVPVAATEHHHHHVPVTREKSNQGLPRVVKETSAGGTTRQLQIPACLQQFASRVDGARKAFEIIAGPTSHDGEGWVAKVVVAVVWRGMRLITDSDTFNLGLARVPSAGNVTKALHGLGKEPTPTVVASPSLAKITNILPSRGASRPASPPRQSDPATHALMSFEGLIKRLVTGLVQDPTAAPTATDSADQEAEYIAREALSEALEALRSAIIASAALHGDNGAVRILNSVRRLRDDVDEESEEKLDDALEDLPSVTLFGMIRRRANICLASLPAEGTVNIRSPAELWNWAPAEFETKVVSGFGPAEEWGPRVARALKPEVERVLAVLGRHDGPKLDAVDWVRALGVALDARTGVKVNGVA